jgi:hypothetical protein
MSCDQCEGRGKVDTVVPGELDDCPACGVCPTCGSLHPDWDEVGEFVPAPSMRRPQPLSTDRSTTNLQLPSDALCQRRWGGISWICSA